MEQYEDNTETSSRPKAQTTADRDGLERDEIKPGSLLTLPKKKAVKLLGRMWAAHDPYMKRRLATWRVNTLRHQGIPGVALIRDGEHWDFYVAPGTSGPDHVPIINKAAEIARKFVAIMLSDPPAPEAMPAGGTEKEILAAEVSTRVLEDLESEANLSEAHTIRRAFMKGCDYGSGFVHYFVDPQGGPRVPVQIEASEFATHVDNALDDGTGQPAPPPYVKRYVTESGRLIPTPNDPMGETLRMRDLPALKREILTGRNVRFVPHTAEDIWDAEGVIIGTFVPLVKLRARFGDELPEPGTEEFQKMLEYRPANARAIAQSGQDIALKNHEAAPEELDEALVFVQTAYFRKSNDYESGAVIITAGNCVMLHRDTWSFTTADGVEEVLDIPVTQYAQFDDGDDDPYYHGLLEIVGKANEMRNLQASAIVDAINRISQRKTFVPVTSMVTEEDLNDPNKRFIPINQGGEPVFENPPPVSQDQWQYYGLITDEMQDAPGLSETAQGLESPTVKSGRQALTIVQQAHAALSTVRGNIERGYQRSGRIKLQLVRAFFDTPYPFSFEEDEYFKLDSWRGSDLGNTRDVQLRMGTLTMLTPAAKAQLAEHWFGLGLIPPDDMARISSTNIGPILGMQTDPFRVRIKRQIQEWLAGPPDEWTPIPPQPQVVMDPTTGQPTVQMIPQPDPVLEGIWEPVPADTMPAVAQLRLTEISRVMATKRYLAKPREWRTRLEQEFMNMSMAVQGIMPSPTMSQPNQAQAGTQSGSPAVQQQAGDMVGMDQNPAANSSERLSPTEQAMSGGAMA